MIDPSRVLAALPQALRGELLDSYQKIMSNYLERRWEPSELNGGKFCEVVYSIVDGALKGSFPANASKPTNMLAACQALEKQPADPNRVGDRSLRVLIPRLLPVLYEIRNNRGVGHVGGDVDPNHMDAEAVQAMASWVMAELVRIFHGVKTEEAQETVDALVERKSPIIWAVGETKRVLDSKMSAKIQVLVLLQHSTGWVSATDLLKWVEYSNASMFRSKVLRPLHKDRLIEFDDKNLRASISPLGARKVEEELLKAAK
ncbi:hypothetical protein IVB30_37640 [Bradyrhizobium sp. 200]|uniref:hypothetical protein n=1 Tax=Bradyrhizobium sp. 200 TaxID=2782665 RepID=UPI001FFF501E|nr:hypothetical protein [Bradyrhizobium sp. 200]UPJ48688.1 hypothetical protein IVB30_37640 [Bradyrhizobium sp. 200]